MDHNKHKQSAITKMKSEEMDNVLKNSGELYLLSQKGSTRMRCKNLKEMHLGL